PRRWIIDRLLVDLLDSPDARVSISVSKRIEDGDHSLLIHAGDELSALILVEQSLSRSQQTATVLSGQPLKSLHCLGMFFPDSDCVLACLGPSRHRRRKGKLARKPIHRTCSSHVDLRSLGPCVPRIWAERC